MTFAAFMYVLVGYVLIVVVLKTGLQIHWTQQLHARYGTLYRYGFIFRKIGRSHYGRFALQFKEGLDPAFLSDLKRVQHRSFVWDLALGALWAAIFFSWLILKRMGF